MSVTVVVPCYNEAGRLSTATFDTFLRSHSDVEILFVDDGSTDRTADMVRSLAAFRGGQARLLPLVRNSGKAEAVRAGLNACLADGATVVGFWDADLATPLDSIVTLIAVLRDHPAIDWVMGSRVKLLGREIHRQPARHYVGRVFATVASISLRLPVYDTQCGAKLFRVSEELKAVLAEPFVARWIFDVEMLARLIRIRRTVGQPVEKSIYEYPLERWEDVRGSKLRLRDYVKAARDMFKIWISLRHV